MERISRSGDPHPLESAETGLRKRELGAFWNSGKQMAEVQRFKPEMTIQAEIYGYYRASVQLGLGSTKVTLRRKRGKIYAQRLG